MKIIEQVSYLDAEKKPPTEGQTTPQEVDRLRRALPG